MGLISRVSSRTYSFRVAGNKFTKPKKMLRTTCVRITRQYNYRIEQLPAAMLHTTVRRERDLIWNGPSQTELFRRTFGKFQQELEMEITYKSENIMPNFL